MDVSPDVGWLTVVCQVVGALADSADEGDAPDAFLPNAAVTFAPVGLRQPFLIHGVDTDIDSFVVPMPVSCRLIDGTLFAAEGTEAGVRLVAPLQQAFDQISWQWRATINTGTAAWTVQFTGAPGDWINLAACAYRSNLQNPSPMPQLWVQDGAAIPDDATEGQYLFDATTGDFFLIGA